MKKEDSKSYYSIEINDFFKSAFSVDCVIFGFDEEGIKVLLIERGQSPFEGKFAIPGDLVYPTENLDDAAHRILNELTGLENVFMEQVHTFGETDRHPIGRVITVCYYSLVKIDQFKVNAASLGKNGAVAPGEAAPELAFDHTTIINTAYQHLKEQVQNQPVCFELLPKKFTLSQVQQLYESVFNLAYDTRNFRKRLLSRGFLTPLKERQKNVAHRPAVLYTFDKKKYQRFKKKGLIFGL